ncbi:hypothetical protein [Streptomyces sp. NPDC057740]|uniref:hypothetical protein n=1 Tax=Streptomyces sp. NPDC057740 TaxID=3346234 RepID=UPI0036C72B1D
MTSSLIRRRSRRGSSHIWARVMYALVGGVVGVAWLVLPVVKVLGGGAVAGGADRAVAGAAAQGEGTSNVDLVLPVLAVVAAVVVGGYGFVRRRRRVRGRTTPGGAPVEAAEPPAGEHDERARALLAEADDWVRVSAEELGFVAEKAEAAELVEPFVRALRDARAELAVAFRMRWQYEGGVPAGDAARRHALAGIVGRCEEAGRLLDARAAAFDQLRGLEEGLGGGLGRALAVAEGRFRELTGRTGGAGAVLRELGERYAPSATAAVAGHVEQAKDRLVFATTRLNQARQSADSGDLERAAGRLRAAEGAISQAAVFIDGVERLAGDLATASTMVPAALTGGEAEIAGARGSPPGALDPYLPVPPGELRARVTHADLALAGVREELTSGRPYDPLDLLRRIVRAVAPVATGRAGVLPAAALLCARAAVAGADDVVATHRAVVGTEPRTHLAEAHRLLAPPAPLADLLSADTLAQQAQELAEQDIRLHGHPTTPTEPVHGLTGALLGGVQPTTGPPASYGGPHTRDRRGDTTDT